MARLLGAAFLAGLVIAGGTKPGEHALAQSGEVTVAADRASYFVGDTATLQVSGLFECAGQHVLAGLGWYSSGELFLATDVVVAEDGTLEVAIVVDRTGASAQAGVAGDCVPGGKIFGPEPIAILHGDPPQADATVAAADTSYLLGETATLKVEGLAECSGQTILIGFFSSPDAVEFFLSTEAIVDDAGSATVELSVDRAGSTAYAAASGDCIPGGSIVSPVLVTLLYVDPPQPGSTPPAPPATGGGLAPEPQSPVSPGRYVGAAILALALVGIAATLALRRR
jgi:hypothetical protein